MKKVKKALRISGQNCTFIWMPNLKFKFWTDSNVGIDHCFPSPPISSPDSIKWLKLWNFWYKILIYETYVASLSLLRFHEFFASTFFQVKYNDTFCEIMMIERGVVKLSFSEKPTKFFSWFWHLLGKHQNYEDDCPNFFVAFLEKLNFNKEQVAFSCAN